MTKTISRLAPVLLSAAAALTLVACGSSGSPSGGASDEEKQLAFQDCLRGQGLDVHVDSNGGVGIRATVNVGRDAGRGRGGAAADVGGPDDRAFATCRKRTGWEPRPPSEAEQAEFRDRALRFARCMRAHGVDMDDPASDGRMMLRLDEGPTARAAMRACGREGGPIAATSERP